MNSSSSVGSVGSVTTNGFLESTTFLFTTAAEAGSRSVHLIVSEGFLRGIGWVLLVVLLVTLVGNVACFYAVFKNLRAILQHPFFQSNVLCVFLSFVDILLVLLVGIPAAVCFTSNSLGLSESYYNLAMVNAVFDCLVWIQLLVVVAICTDRAGHICRPLTYTYSAKPYKTVLAILTCTFIPLLSLILPYSLAASASQKGALQDYGDSSQAFICNYADVPVTRSDGEIGNLKVFMTCGVQLRESWFANHQVLFRWYLLANPLLLLLAVLALSVSSGLIVWKLVESARFQKTNKQRQDEVARSIRLTCFVSFMQAILIVISTLPFRWYQIDKALNETSQTLWEGYSNYYIITARCLVFLGPMFNPWLYPIRMASIRSFLNSKKKTVVSSVSTRFSRIRSLVTGPTGHSVVGLSTSFVDNSTSVLIQASAASTQI